MMLFFVNGRFSVVSAQSIAFASHPTTVAGVPCGWHLVEPETAQQGLQRVWMLSAR